MLLLQNPIWYVHTYMADTLRYIQRGRFLERIQRNTFFIAL